MDDPDVDAFAVTVKAILACGKKRGFVTYDQLNRALPPQHFSSEQIEDMLAILSEMGIQVVEGENGDDEDDDPVAGDPRSPRGPLPFRGEADPDKPPNTIDARSSFQSMPTSSEEASGRG